MTKEEHGKLIRMAEDAEASGKDWHQHSEMNYSAEREWHAKGEAHAYRKAASMYKPKGRRPARLPEGATR